MTLAELLEHIAEEVLQDRAAIVSGPAKVIWSDRVLVRYFNKAEQIFARRTYCLIDDTTAACCEIQLVEGQSSYSLHASVLEVLSTRMDDTSIELQKTNHQRLQASMAATVSNGRPLVWVTDNAARKILVYPPPNADEAAHKLKLRVSRLPVTSMTLSALTATPEIPEHYHLDLVDYVAYRALTHQEVDGSARKEALAFKAQWEESVRDARRDIKYLMDRTTGSVFGGWGNG